MDVDAEYDHDASLAMYEARGARGNVEQRARRDKAAQVCFRVQGGERALLRAKQCSTAFGTLAGEWVIRRL